MKNWIFAIIVFFGGSLLAQEESLVTIKVTLSNGNLAEGTGAVVKKLKDAPKDGYYSHILTAAHVVEGASSAKLLYPNGVEVERARVISRDEKSDVAILEGWTPNSVTPIPLANEVKEEEEIFVYSPRGVRRTKVAIMNDTTVYADIMFVSGESGSPVLNNKKEVIGVVSGGHAWFENKKLEIRLDVRQNSAKEKRTATWPGLIGRLDNIRKMVK